MREQVALMRVVIRDYLPTIGARLREGRFFEISDRRSKSPVAIVNETCADRHFPGRSAIGERFQYGQLNYGVGLGAGSLYNLHHFERGFAHGPHQR
jgi:hypothetical protein